MEVFDWDLETQQYILGVFYYGHTVTPILGGWLVGNYGGFRILLIAMILSSLMALSAPITAKINIGLLFVNRIIDGFGQVSIV